MKLKNIFVAFATVALSVGFTSCSDDDEPGGGSGKTTISVAGTSSTMKYCYVDLNDKDRSTDLIFTTADVYGGAIPKTFGEFNIWVDVPFGTEGTFGPDKYELFYFYIPNTQVDYDKISITRSCWIPRSNFLSEKDPGNLTIKYDGDKITCTLDNYWMAIDPDKGHADEFEFEWANGSLKDFSWANGSFSYTGTYKIEDDMF